MVHKTAGLEKRSTITNGIHFHFKKYPKTNVPPVSVIKNQWTNCTAL